MNWLTRSENFSLNNSEDTVQAVYELRDMHIDASLVDDTDTALLANLLIEPTPDEFATSP